MSPFIIALLLVAVILFVIEGIQTKSLVAWGLAALSLAFVLSRGFLNG